MGIPTTLILTYLFGGLTFLPILFVLVCLHAYFTFPIHLSQTEASEYSSDSLHDINDDGRNIKTGASASEISEKFHRRHEPDVAAGYFAVCREYVPGGINGKPPERTTPAGAVIAMESPSVYQSMYRSLFDRRQGSTMDPGKANGKSVKRARNVFFVVLRHGHLMLYEDSEQVEVKHVISLEHHNVGIYAGDETDFIPEGELWIRRNAIRLARKKGLRDPVSIPKPFFLFSENCSDKEDFYFALLQNQEVKPDAQDSPPRPQQYETKHIIRLVQKLHSSEEHLQTRWINGLIGRLFLAIYKTKDSENFIRKKIAKKIARVKKPAFLSDIILQKIDMGESAPQIINPRLKDLTIDGDCCAEADFRYSGNFRLEIAATARIDLGTRFKAREVQLVLAVVVKKLHGHALVKFKPPPSNRIWVSFETMPDMEMTIEPIVSSRQITYGIILRAIESRIREVMAETLVLPHWDDLPFTDTVDQGYRGGIWADQAAKDQPLPEHSMIPDEAPEDEADIDFDPSSSPQIPLRRANERFSVSSESSPTSAPGHLQKAVTNSTPTLIDSIKDTTSGTAQKPTEPPKALRSRSFAAVANPLLSMDNANMDPLQLEENRKEKQDATSAMMAISNRSRPTSPKDDSNSLGGEADTTLWEMNQESRSRSSTTSDLNGQQEQSVGQGPSTDKFSQISLPQTPTSSSTRSTTKSDVESDSSQLTAPQAHSRTSTIAEKRQSIAALGAATAAAKNWSWGVLNRNASQKFPQERNSDRDGIPKHPIGRGRPLPPPGQPLPLPDGARSKVNTASAHVRKPVALSGQFPRRQDETKPHTDVPPPLPTRKRQSAAFSDTPNDGMLVVEAPPDPEPSSPVEDKYDESTSGVRSETSEGASLGVVFESIPPDKELTILGSAQSDI